jgi:hypothetical protein
MPMALHNTAGMLFQTTWAVELKPTGGSGAGGGYIEGCWHFYRSHGARFQTEFCARGCQWIPRMFASREHACECDQWYSVHLLFTVVTINHAQTLKAQRALPGPGSWNRGRRLLRLGLLLWWRHLFTQRAPLCKRACTGSLFRQKLTLEDAIEFHAFAPLEALAGM